MTPEEHTERHKMLHQMLDELFADYIAHHPNDHNFLAMPFGQFLTWSALQARNATDPPRAIPQPSNIV